MLLAGGRIHGGGFKVGSGDLYDGTGLAAMGDGIVVGERLALLPCHFCFVSAGSHSACCADAADYYLYESSTNPPIIYMNRRPPCRAHR